MALCRKYDRILENKEIPAMPFKCIYFFRLILSGRKIFVHVEYNSIRHSGISSVGQITIITKHTRFNSLPG